MNQSRLLYRINSGTFGLREEKDTRQERLPFKIASIITTVAIAHQLLHTTQN